jgi:hypothetical protein
MRVGTNISLSKLISRSFDCSANVNKTGGQELNSPHNSQQASNHSPERECTIFHLPTHHRRSDRSPRFAVDEDHVVKKAQEHGSGDSSIFNSALGFLNKNKVLLVFWRQNSLIDASPSDRSSTTNRLMRSTSRTRTRRRTRTPIPGRWMPPRSAALLLSKSAHSQPPYLATAHIPTQALKTFTSDGGSGKSQNDLVSFAMAEASNLFDKSGSSGGGKQDAVNGAAMTVMKLVVQSKLKSSIGGGDSGGLGGLLGMVT